jgi:hypothetical protein
MVLGLSGARNAIMFAQETKSLFSIYYRFALPLPRDEEPSWHFKGL